MLKVLFAFLLILDLIVSVLLIAMILGLIKGGGFNIVFPGLGLIVAGPFIMLLLLVVEIVLLTLTWFLSRRIKNDADKLA